MSISDVLFHFPNLQKVASVLIGEIFTQLHNLACELFPEIDSGAPPDLWLARMETLYSKRKQLVRHLLNENIRGPAAYKLLASKQRTSFSDDKSVERGTRTEKARRVASLRRSALQSRLKLLATR